MDLEPIETDACIRTVNNKLMVEVGVDTTEALEGIKEVTEAANECAAALEKLEKVMGKFNKNDDALEINMPLILNGRAIAEATKRIKQDIIRATPFV
ncbi:hypothetical protein OMD49_06480 [Bacillus anthracis]|nr:hypothetical protein [Bacillus anthracis]